MLKKIVLKLIKLYQKTLSPSYGFLSPILSERFCRFSPTCSEYTYKCIERYGIIKGSFLGLWRVSRCNPFSKGGLDSPPLPSKANQMVFKGGLALFLYFLFFFILYRILFFIKK